MANRMRSLLGGRFDFTASSSPLARRRLSRSGRYAHTPTELAFGARLAWRNHGRCIGAACPMFHLKLRNFHPVPNFYTARADDGGRLMPFYGDQYQSRQQRFADRLMRRWKLWKRMAW